jgi:hypothetical protein
MFYKVLGMLLFCPLLSIGSTNSNDELSFWSPSLEEFIQDRNQEIPLSSQLQESSLVIFPGINSEFEKEDSFNELRRIVESSQGAIDLTIHWPDSLNPAAVNAQKIVEVIEHSLGEREAANPPLILLGHSKGGLELLYACMNRPDLCNSSDVALVVILQSPVGGTRTADELFDASGKAKKIFSFIFSFIPSVNKEVLLGGGMRSVRTASVLEEYRKINFDHANESLNKVVFIASVEDRDDWSRELQIPNRNFIGDGIIPLEQARHMELEQNKAYKLSCDHLDLVIRKPRSNKSDIYKYKFWKSLLHLREDLLRPSIR